MRFQAKLARAIVQGKKTQTRRPVKMIRADDDGRMIQGACKYKVGRDYSIQGASGRSLSGGARLKVIAVRCEEIGTISFEDARAEGFKTRDDFFEAWDRIYPGLDRETRVWVITFQSIDEERYMAAQIGSGERMGGSTDYVHGPFGAVEDGQALPASIQDRYTKEAREREVVDHPARLQERELLTKRNKLRKLEQEANRKGVDISPELSGAIEAVQAKLKGRTAA